MPGTRQIASSIAGGYLDYALKGLKLASKALLQPNPQLILLLICLFLASDIFNHHTLIKTYR